MTKFAEPEEYSISSHYLSALINGDYSGLDDNEDEKLDEWIEKAQAKRKGHWDCWDDDSDNFLQCAVTGLRASCAIVTFNPIID